MQNFEYCTPTNYVFGKGVVDKLPEYLSHYGKRVLLTYGGGSIKRSGLYDKVKELLKDFEVFELSGIEPNPKYTSVVEGVNICKDKKIEVLLAVGGGSVLDCTKAIAAGACADCEPWDLIRYKVPTKAALPILDIITMAATGSEYDNGGVITNEATHDKVGYGSDLLFPKVSFVDPTYTYTVPTRQTIAGVADAMNHIMEQYFNSDPNNLMDGIMESALRSLKDCVVKVLKNPEDYDARAEIFLNASLACNGIYSLGEGGSGWPMHAIEHTLSAYYDITHGIGLAILTPRWLNHILSDKTAGRIAKYSRNVFDVDKSLSDIDAAKEGIRRTYKFFESIGIPMHLKDVGIDNSKVREMAEHTQSISHLDRKSIYAPLSVDDIESIIKESL